MKIPALLTCLLATLLAAVPLHRAHADEVNFDVFYNSLADDGDWYNTPEYGYVWQPYVAAKSDRWRPYSDGYWAQTEDGWTWVSYENFGWAAYHYGRWTRLKDLGWAWVPGYDWGPGWVSWRTSDNYVGWAPLPPKVEDGVYDGRVVDADRTQIDYNDVEPADAGYGTNVDVQYDIGPANYCFVDTRSFGAPVLSEVLLPPQQNITIIERTTNVTNIYYQRDQGRTVVYNTGPNFAFIDSHVDRPIQHLRLERQDQVDYLHNSLRGGGNPTLVRNGVLQVASPTITRGPVNFAQVKPPRVKQTLAHAQVIRGWANSGADQAAQQRIRAQYKQQAAAAPPRPANPVLPPAAAGRERPERAAGNTPPAANSAQPFVARQPGQPAPASQAPLTEADRLSRRDAQQRERDQRAGVQPTPAAAQPNVDQDKEARRAARQAARANGQPSQPAEAAQLPPTNRTDDERATRKPVRQPESARPAEPSANAPAADPDREARRAARQTERANQPAVQEARPEARPEVPADQDQAARRAARQQERVAQPERQPERATPPERQAQPQGQNGNTTRESRREEQPKQGKPGQSPAP